jgi:glycosyltransferase involved in cell wall biosynthesis/LmbE family N-acetylglucosaminyl deacetylase/SAM-dependent methyltransferase
MHICFLSLDYPSSTSGGGVGNQVCMLGQALVAAGHRATVLALADPELPAFIDDEGVRVFRVQTGHMHWYVSKTPLIGPVLSQAIRELEYSLAFYRQLCTLHSQEPFDVIEGTETSSVAVGYLLKDVPLIIRLHGERYTFDKYTPDRPMTNGTRLGRLVQRISIRHAKILISPSQAHAREIAEELKQKHPPIHVVPNAVTIHDNAYLPRENIDSHELIKAYTHIVPESPIILYTGRLEHLKGIAVLLEAARIVLMHRPEVQFVLAGAKHPSLAANELEQLLLPLPKNRVYLLGHLSHEQLLRWYRRADICVLPSYYETFGVAALEAMSYGVPVVASTAGALPEVVLDSVTGLLTPPGDSHALANAIIRLLEDPLLSHHLATNGQERAKAQFDIARLIDANLDAYKLVTSIENELTEQTEHIFFSPHSDDVALSCGGYIAALRDQDQCVTVVTVFAKSDSSSVNSAFARYLHAKWGIDRSKLNLRLDEDRAALDALGVRSVESWDLIDAPFRSDSQGWPLYSSLEELRDVRIRVDEGLILTLRNRIENWLDVRPGNKTVYFPLSLAEHVDHRILFLVGVYLIKKGARVLFYEEWPYVESYSLQKSIPDWSCQMIDIDLETKIRSVRLYKSQIKGLGGSEQVLSDKVRRFSTQAGKGKPKERYWSVSQMAARRMLDSDHNIQLPFSWKESSWSLRHFGRFIETLRWHDLGEVLPVGTGFCLDIGCGSGRHRLIIEQRGYSWAGLDTDSRIVAVDALNASCSHLPFQTACAGAAVAWQVMEYLEHPEALVVEAARVLEPGGVFCGSVSFLEPVHGRTFYGLSPLILENLLRKHGFKDIQILPGLSGFSLLLWTFLRRLAGERIAELALPLTMAWLLPLAGLRFLISWLLWRLGVGTGHGMHWVVETAPLEFAGHVLFVARKAARSGECTSDS